jgi:hypothetical protein
VGPPINVPSKERGWGAAWRAVRRRGVGELARSSVKRFWEADGTTHARALAYQSMFVLLAGFIGLVGLASAFDLPRVRGIVEQMADTLSPGPSGQLLREAARQGAEGGTAAMVLGLLAALLAGTLAMAQVERYANGSPAGPRIDPSGSATASRLSWRFLRGCSWRPGDFPSSVAGRSPRASVGRMRRSRSGP